MGLKNTADNTYLNIDLSRFNLDNPMASKFLGFIHKDKATRDQQSKERFSSSPESVKLPIQNLFALTIDSNNTTAKDIRDEFYRCLALTEEYSVAAGWTTLN